MRMRKCDLLLFANIADVIYELEELLQWSEKQMMMYEDFIKQGEKSLERLKKVRRLAEEGCIHEHWDD